MKNLIVLFFSLILLGGCSTEKKNPQEQQEIDKIYGELVQSLSESLKAEEAEKYDKAGPLFQKVLDKFKELEEKDLTQKLAKAEGGKAQYIRDLFFLKIQNISEETKLAKHSNELKKLFAKPEENLKTKITELGNLAKGLISHEGQWISQEELKKVKAFEQKQLANGFVKQNGKWISQKELESAQQKAKGMVLFQEQWVTPMEKENLEKGLVRYRGKWISPKEKAKEEEKYRLAKRKKDLKLAQQNKSKTFKKDLSKKTVPKVKKQLNEIVPKKRTKPQKPLALEKPKTPSKFLNKKDLTTLSANDLRNTAGLLANRGNFKEAVQFQHFATQKLGEGYYELACYYSLLGDQDSGFYWLQVAAEKEGDTQRFSFKDSPGFAGLVKDSRWNRVQSYLDGMDGYWQSKTITKTHLILPKGYSKSKSIPLFVGLHGDGSNEYFVDKELQGLANKINVAFLGISGSIPLGKGKFMWSNNVVKDHFQIQQGLKQIKGKIKIKKIGLFGFSSGAQMAFEVAANFHSKYCGAIVIAPGIGGQNRPLDAISYDNANKEQRFVFTIGNELPRRVALARKDYAWTQKKGLKSSFFFHKELKEHTYPPNFLEKFESWLKFVLDQ